MDFSGMLQTWINVLTKPGEAVFEEERQSPNATLSTAIIWIIISAFVSAIFAVVSMAISFAFNVGFNSGDLEALFAEIDPALASELGGMIGAGAGLGIGAIMFIFCTSLILTPLFFLIGSAIYFGIAKLLGGTGEFEEQTYLLSTIAAPLGIVSSLVNIVPLLGPCVALLLWIYQIVLNYYAFKVTHQLTSGRALMVALAPIVLALLLVCCVFVGVIAMVSAVPQ